MMLPLKERIKEPLVVHRVEEELLVVERVVIVVIAIVEVVLQVAVVEIVVNHQVFLLEEMGIEALALLVEDQIEVDEK